MVDLLRTCRRELGSVINRWTRRATRSTSTSGGNPTPPREAFPPSCTSSHPSTPSSMRSSLPCPSNLATWARRLGGAGSLSLTRTRTRPSLRRWPLPTRSGTSLRRRRMKLAWLRTNGTTRLLAISCGVLWVSCLAKLAKELTEGLWWVQFHSLSCHMHAAVLMCFLGVYTAYQMAIDCSNTRDACTLSVFNGE